MVIALSAADRAPFVRGGGGGGGREGPPPPSPSLRLCDACSSRAICAAAHRWYRFALQLIEGIAAASMHPPLQIALLA